MGPLQIPSPEKAPPKATDRQSCSGLPQVELLNGCANCSTKSKTASKNQSISTFSDLSNLNSIVMHSDGVESSQRQRRASVRKTGDWEFFHMTYLANLLTHPQKNKLIQFYGNDHFRRLFN